MIYQVDGLEARVLWLEYHTGLADLSLMKLGRRLLEPSSRNLSTVLKCLPWPINTTITILPWEYADPMQTHLWCLVDHEDIPPHTKEVAPKFLWHKNMGLQFEGWDLEPALRGENG